ncbi:hypothetical protein M153_2040004040 [Pseudoloma neurophilia]|uniref:Uncharacterized protein n=1 Tax=Pseudoloma neurophilia TaxID=146866 RepID=A0A0R0M628_9MICR|nr:hypothetical protein M153_2040004040 [Pseudoloma neurophilia]
MKRFYSLRKHGGNRGLPNQRQIKSFISCNQGSSGCGHGKQSMKGRIDCCDSKESKIQMYRRMKRDEINVKLFILQNEKDFGKLKEIERLSAVVKVCDQVTQTWFYKLGATDNLPSKFEDFKIQFERYFEDEGLEGCIRWINESWSKYLRRV